MLRSIETKNRKKLLDIWNDNQRIFDSLSLPNSPEDLETLIQDKTAHAEMLGGGNDVVRCFFYAKYHVMFSH